MRFLYATILLFFGIVFKLDAMKIDDQEFVAVSIYKRACEIGLVSQKEMNVVNNMGRWSNKTGKSSDSRKLNGRPKENYVRIDLIYLFTKAVIESWKKSFMNQCPNNNQYMDFLLENKMPLYDIVALQQILNNSIYEKSNSGEFLSCLKKSENFLVFEEMFFENLKLLGLVKGFYWVSKKKYDRIIGMGEKLVFEKNMTIEEYQKAKIYEPIWRDPKKFVVGEDWISDLYCDAVKYGIVSVEKRKGISLLGEKIGINPVDVLISAMFQFVAFDSKICDFLMKYGISAISILRITPLIQYFFYPDNKIVQSFENGSRVTEIVLPSLSGMQYILHNVTKDLAEIGIYNGIYYFSKDKIIPNQ